MQIVQNILELITKFHLQILAANNSFELDNTFNNNNNRESLSFSKTYKTFHKCTNFLYIVLSKLYEKGHKLDEHFGILLMEWNYNSFYKSS